MSAIKVTIVDDSALLRRHLSERLTAAGIQVIGTASDPLFAMPMLQANWPDVIVLDVEMPRMDGITFLKQIMAEHPTPVVMCSTLTEKGCDTTMQALSAGAVGFVTKPKLGLKAFLEDDANGIVAAVRAAAHANMRALRRPMAVAAPRQAPTPAVEAKSMAVTTDRVIAMGLSTGGVQTLEAVATRLPRTLPGIVVVQHMPEKFTASFAERLNSLCEIDVAEARNGDRVINGRMLIAPGGKQMRLRRNGAQYVVEVKEGPLVNRHCPSVDVLFRSVAECAGRNASGIIMTGMGDDGARGLLAMRQAGARTAAQDEASCVVFGMPHEAIKLGAAGEVLPLDAVAGWLTSTPQV
ncbi:chemotaxis response regulator protein-glutamate methylesterase [Aquabacterium sp.]|uniref:protein-glutamate methylesterase/protein-glutamine glutaminase n=1 Tax=Aquabacterium sp. TaxID=1872578 RepID=UPI0035B20770